MDPVRDTTNDEVDRGSFGNAFRDIAFPHIEHSERLGFHPLTFSLDNSSNVSKKSLSRMRLLNDNRSPSDRYDSIMLVRIVRNSVYGVPTVITEFADESTKRLKSLGNEIAFVELTVTKLVNDSCTSARSAESAESLGDDS